jgi:hypothetical protein
MRHTEPRSGPGLSNYVHIDVLACGSPLALCHTWPTHIARITKYKSLTLRGKSTGRGNHGTISSHSWGGIFVFTLWHTRLVCTQFISPLKHILYSGSVIRPNAINDSWRILPKCVSDKVKILGSGGYKSKLHSRESYGLIKYGECSTQFAPDLSYLPCDMYAKYTQIKTVTATFRVWNFVSHVTSSHNTECWRKRYLGKHLT